MNHKHNGRFERFLSLKLRLPESDQTIHVLAFRNDDPSVYFQTIFDDGRVLSCNSLQAVEKIIGECIGKPIFIPQLSFLRVSEFAGREACLEDEEPVGRKLCRKTWQKCLEHLAREPLTN